MDHEQGKAYEVLRDSVLKRQQADIGSALQVCGNDDKGSRLCSRASTILAVCV
jgi:hypothetical protein